MSSQKEEGGAVKGSAPAALGGLWWVQWGSYFRGEPTTTKRHLMADKERTTCGIKYPWALTDPKFVPEQGPFCTRCLAIALSAASSRKGCDVSKGQVDVASCVGPTDGAAVRASALGGAGVVRSPDRATPVRPG